MNRKDSPQQFDAREEGKGSGPAARPRATEPTPGGIDRETPSEAMPAANDSRASDGLAKLKEMEENAEDGRE